MERKDLMEDFRKQAVEISQHADDIDTLRFEARLKNGTRFSFNYDDELFTRHENGGSKVKEKRVSTTNGVSDIVSAAIALTLMCVSAGTKLTAGATGANALLLITYISFSVYFVVSSIYHLFTENHKRTLKALYLVRHVLSCVSLLLMGLCVNANGYERGSAYVVFLFIAVLSVFLASLDTRMGARLSMLAQLLFSVALLFAAPATPLLIGVSLLIAINSLIGCILPPESGNLRTNPAFLIAALLVFYTVI